MTQNPNRAGRSLFRLPIVASRALAYTFLTMTLSLVAACNDSGSGGGSDTPSGGPDNGGSGGSSNNRLDNQEPTVPGAFAAKSLTDASVELSWSASNDNVGVTGYEIYSGDTMTLSVTALDARVESLTAATNYALKVRAVDAAGNKSAFSPALSITTLSMATDASGAALFMDRGCVGCHGLDGVGINESTSLKGPATLASLTSAIANTMPPAAPGTCTGPCADAVALYIYNNFSDKVATITDPLAGMPTGNAQLDALCARLATRNVNDRVRTAFCGATRPTITSLTQLQTALGLDFDSPNLTGRGNNGNGGNPGFAISGHSSSLVARSVSAINPRAILFTPPNGNVIPNFVAMGFVRGDQFAEIIARDSNNNALDFYLARFKQACNANNSCTPGDLLTPAVESNWTDFTIYDEGDLKNTIVDCTHCHQVNGPGTPRILRMQELADPWNHWFRDNRVGGQALIADYQAAHGTTEAYAGIPGALINASDPAELEDLVRDHGFGNQPNIFNSNNIQNQVNQTNGQPQNNDIPGTSTAWNTIFNNAVQGRAIPVPYHDIKVTESSTLNTLTQAYQRFRAGQLAASALPDLRNVFKTSRLFEIAGIAAPPGQTGQQIVTTMCTQCHRTPLDQTISRARFNVNLAAMSDLNGGVLTGAARDAEIGVAITRLMLPAEDVRKMPPETFKTLSAAEIDLVITYLCSETTTPIPQCAGR